MAGMASFAQDIDDSFVFVDAAGNELTNDTVITRTDITEDPFGDSYISSGLYVKNVSGGIAYLKMESAVTQLPSGTTHSICFPGNCINHTAVGTYESKDPEGEANESVSDMRAEWINKGVEGTCTVTYTIKVYEYEGKQPNNFGIPVDTYSFIGDGRKITVNYTTDKSAGISGAKTEANELQATYYTMDGRCVAQPGKGLYIKKAKLADGTVKTVKMEIK